MLGSILKLTAIFAALCAGTLLIPVPAGWHFLLLVLFFALLFGGFSFLNRERFPELWAIWLFSTIVSIFQVLPDWFLSAVLGVLVFPEDGVLKIGTVSGYMAGLWAIPFFFILLSGRLYQGAFTSEQWLSHGSEFKAALLCGFVGLLIFAASEASLWMLGSWYARNVSMVGHVAVYVLLPEFMLGFFLYQHFHLSQNKPWFYWIFNGFKISLLYTGALALSYLLMEKVA
ncbi:MAG: hypothetical protein RH862_04150 [Leptospiraceae bacterium]